MDRLGFALAGMGYPDHGIPWAEAAKTVPGGELVGVSASGEFDRREVIERTDFGGLYGQFVDLEVLDRLTGGAWYDDWRELVTRDDVDVVIVNSVPTQHREITCAALEAGKHVIVEKPIATTLEDADAMIECAERCGRELMVPFNLRFLPAYQEVRRLLDAGAIGRLVSGYGSAHWRWDDNEAGARPGEVNEWRARRLDVGGGLIFEETIHLVDLLRWFSGGEVTEITAFRDNFGHRAGSPIGEHPEGVEDRAAAVCRFDNGMYGLIDTSFIQGATWQTRLQGTKGEIHVTHRLNEGYVDNPEVFLYTEDGEHRYFRVQGENRMNAVVQHFAECVRAGRRPRPDGRDGRQALAVLLAMFTSAQEGRMVAL